MKSIVDLCVVLVDTMYVWRAGAGGWRSGNRGGCGYGEGVWIGSRENDSLAVSRVGGMLKGTMMRR
jgi:hypothetical protein